jgi:hypothetical protein
MGNGLNFVMTLNKYLNFLAGDHLPMNPADYMNKLMNRLRKKEKKFSNIMKKIYIFTGLL